MNFEDSNKNYFLGLILGAILLLASLRLITFAIAFSVESLQMDFSAFYTAGESLNYQLSPYINHIIREPRLWDGVDNYTHSRFLYPPLVAVLFQPFAAIPYIWAKSLWTLISLSALVGSLYLTYRVFPLKNKIHLLLASCFVPLFHPLFAHVERGQIDTLTLVLLCTAFSLMHRRNTGKDFWAGGLLALATMLKLHCIYILPFVLLKKRFQIAKGFIFSSLFLITLSLVVTSHGDTFYCYLCDHFPRISKYGEGGTPEMKLDEEIIRNIKAELPEEMTVKDGRLYKIESFSFSSNVTLVRPIKYILSRAGIAASYSTVSLSLFGLAVFIFHLGQKRYFSSGDLSEQDDLLYWHAVLIVILLCGPCSWVMNAVWLIPGIIILFSEFSHLRERKHAKSLTLVALGLFFVAIPDHHTFELLLPKGRSLVPYKYIVGELLVLSGWLLTLHYHTKKFTMLKTAG
ncbi:MAG: DUF2029 domain-containing protein [Desulfobulbaceae bacterium]|nr:DUF2029 domain-containing protein [Desulfobulbaceae bacterium]